jgi:hypothetical protein
LKRILSHRALFRDPKHPDRPDVNPPAPTEVKVRCGGGVHRVVFDGTSLGLPDHPQLARDEILFGFGGRCRCLEVRRAWVARARDVLPDGLLDAYDGWRVARPDARARRGTTGVTLWAIKNAVELRSLQAARATLAQCPYKLGRGWLSFAVGDRPGVFKNEWGQVVTVSCGWYSRVFLREMAVIDGRFVLSVLTRDDVDHRQMPKELKRPARVPWWVGPFGEAPDLSQTCVLALFQARGAALRPQPAIATTTVGPDGLSVRTLRVVGR